MKKYLLLFVLLLLPMLFFGCTQNTGPGTGNMTQNASLSAQYGDTVTVDYTLRVNGSVVDTSRIDVAKQAGIYSTSKSYQPLTYKMLVGGGVIDGFVSGILGMRVGESKNFTVSPADGYGQIDPSRISKIPRAYNMSVFEEVPISFFSNSNITLSNSTIISTDIGYVRIQNVTNSTVTIRYLFYPGQSFSQNGLPQTVMNVTNDTMLIRFDMEENKSYTITDPVTGQTSTARVPYADNSTIVLDENPELAGKELDFEVTVRSIIR